MRTFEIKFKTENIEKNFTIKAKGQNEAFIEVLKKYTNKDGKVPSFKASIKPLSGDINE